MDDLAHVVGLVRRIRYELVELPVVVGDGQIHLGVVVDGGILQVVLRQVADQVANVFQGVVLVRSQVVRVPRPAGVGAATAQLLHGDILARDGPDHLGAGDEHLRGLVHHHHEIRQGGGVDVTTRCRAHDQRDLRDHPGGPGVAAEDLPVQGQGHHPLLDARTAALVYPDQRASGLQREVDDLDDLLAVDLAQRPAEDRHVLTEDADGAAMDGSGAGDHTVPVGAAGIHPEVLGTVPGELVQFRETALVQESQHPFPGGHLALGVLLLNGAG